MYMYTVTFFEFTIMYPSLAPLLVVALFINAVAAQMEGATIYLTATSISVVQWASPAIKTGLPTAYWNTSTPQYPHAAPHAAAAVTSRRTVIALSVVFSVLGFCALLGGLVVWSRRRERLKASNRASWRVRMSQWDNDLKRSADTAPILDVPDFHPTTKILNQQV